uniref:Wzz/FepE/Etk N-terminal domain-containing protein n=1 Tax=Algoriphagus sp. TaxID=1872435 RepID=UPI0040486D9E
MTDNTPSPSNSEDEIDLRDLILPLWKARKQILTIATICGILGGIIGFLTPVTYTASSTFLPQTSQSGGGLSGSLGGLASLAGINLSTGATGGGEIPPTMYARVLASEPFKKRLLDATIWVDGDTISYRNYLESRTSSGFGLGTIKEYTIGLPGKILGSITKDKKDGKVNADGGLQALSDEEYALNNAIAGKVNIETDKKEGVVSITVVESDPLVAAEVAKVTEEVLQEWIIDHKIKNAKAQYDFIEKQFDAKQKEFFSIQDQLAGYMDRNQNVLSATYLTRLERLQAEFDLVNTVYSELAKQKEQAAIQLSKDTPTFSVLDPVKVPKEKTGPKKSLYVLGTFFIGLILAAGWFLARKPVQEFFKGITTQ